MITELTSTEIIEELNFNRQILSERFFVKEIGLFGSFARNEATLKSDIDFLVLIDAPVENYKSIKESLRRFLKRKFGRKIDLANPNSLKPHYKDKILAQVIYV